MDWQLSPEALRERLARGEPLVLVDVREPWEVAIARIPGSLNIPLGDLAERHEELDRAATHVLVCHHGVRSMHALGLLRHFGFERLKNLAGGIEAWSEIDPSTPRY